MDSKGIINSIFGVRRALIGVIHVDALPGTPGNQRQVAEIAEAAALKPVRILLPGFTASSSKTRTIGLTSEARLDPRSLRH